MHRFAVLLLIAGCAPDATWDVQATSPTAEEPIFYGQTSPTLYSLTTAQQNAVVALVYSYYGQGFCTGTVVSPHVVVTAAHCIDTPEGALSASDILVHVGPNYETPLAVLTVTAVDYKNWTLEETDDIGILILQDTYSSVTPIPIKRGGISSMYGDAQSVGFGRTQSSTDYDPNPYRNWTTMDVTDVTAYNGQIEVDGHGSTGVAPGDSGGPLLYDFGSGVQLSGIASTSMEGWVYKAYYTPISHHEAWVQQYVDYYDNPACVSACAGVECGPTGACECGTCAYGYECVANQCEEVQPGVGGACVRLDSTYVQCTTDQQCASDEACFQYGDGNSECGEICGPESCVSGQPGSFCMPLEGLFPVCVETSPAACSTEGDPCNATGGRSGLCFELFQNDGLKCWARCDPVVTCPQGTACIAYQTDCNTLCSNVDCGEVGSCDCGDDCGYGYVCSGNECVCSPTCEGKQCGSDGCDGFCGTCAYGYVCNPYGRCILYDDYYGTGDDGVEGNCGNCGAAPAGPLALLALIAVRRRRSSQRRRRGAN